MKKIRKFFSYGYLLVVLLFILVSLGLRFTNQVSYFGYQLRVVLSGSMAPEIPKNSIVLVKEVNDETVAVGDVVTLEVAGEYVTHRVVNIGENDHGIVYETKGDSNKFPDREQRRKEELVGKVVFSVPRVGKLFLLLGTSRGFIALMLSLLLLLLLRYFFGLIMNESVVNEPVIKIGNEEI